MEELGRKFPPNGIRICIDEKETDIKGRAYLSMWTEPILFVGIEELLLKIDHVFNKVGYPQAFQEKRTFWEKKEKSFYGGVPTSLLDEEDLADKKGNIDTFDIIVSSRRNTSWQGSVYDLEGGKITDFDGELELLRCLASE